MSTEDNLLPFDFAARRDRVFDEIGDGIAIFQAPPLAVHTNDVEHRYRPNSDFYYLTGFEEPDAVAVLNGAAADERFVLFVLPKDPERETWTGRRQGVEGAVDRFGADAAYPIEEFETRLPSLIGSAGTLHQRLGLDEAFDQRVLRSARKGWAARPRTSGQTPNTIRDPSSIVHELRLFKSEAELRLMRKAIAIADEAHREAMKATRPGMHEYEIEALLEYHFRRHGASGWAYPSIVAGGENATVLHYTSNEDVLDDGELLLIDAGDEFGWYCADITRTFPIGTDFSAEQRRVYDTVLDAQEAAIAAVRPGATIESVHETALERLVDGLLSMGLVSGSVESVMRDESYRRFYMHRTSHWLGMDVHDVGAYGKEGRPRPLEPGMVLTVEPGLYLSRTHADLPTEYAGIGVRIEDDVLVTETGAEVLSDVPKRPDEVLQACAG